MKTEFTILRDFDVIASVESGGFVQFDLNGVVLPIGTAFHFQVFDNAPLGAPNGGSGIVTGIVGTLITTNVVATISAGALITGTLTVTHNVDLTDEVPIPLTYALDDIFDLSKRKTPFSKTIKVPGTSNNNLIFNHIYKIESHGNFDPRIKTRCRINSQGLLMLDGTICLDGIDKIILRGIESISYNVIVYGKAFNFFDLLGDKTIKDLDFSRYDHVLSVESIFNSWACVNNLSGGIPLVTDFAPTPTLATQTIDYTSPVSFANLSSTTVDGIGRVTMTFPTNHAFVPGDEVFVLSDIHRVFGTQTIIATPTNKIIVFAMVYANLTTNITSASHFVEKRTWLAIGYHYPCVDYGRYQKFQTSGVLEIGKDYRIVTLEPGDSFLNLQDSGINPGLTPSNNPGTVFSASDGVSVVGNTVAPTSWISGSVLVGSELKSDGGELGPKDDTINKWRLTDFIPHIHVREVWTKMFELIGVNYDWSMVDTDLFRRLIMPCNQNFDREDDGGVNVGSVVYMNDWLPDMKLKDFFTTICNMFNLFILPEGQNTIKLVNRGDYFTTNVVRRNIDAGSPLEVKLCNSLLPKWYQIKYKDGTDFFNEDYNRDIGNISNAGGYANDIDRKYGDWYYNTGNEFATDENKVELGFMPTVLAGPLPGPPAVYNESDRTISVAYSADSEGNNVTRDTANRILIAGLRGTNNTWSLRTQQALTSKTEVNNYNYGTHLWPYAGHLQNVFDGNPIHDLNFDITIAQYFPYVYDATKWSNVCLARRYWAKYLKDLISVDGKKITATIKLTASEIHALAFSDINLVDDFQCKLLKVIDWDVTGDGICKCEFLLKT